MNLRPSGYEIDGRRLLSSATVRSSHNLSQVNGHFSPLVLSLRLRPSAAVCAGGRDKAVTRTRRSQPLRGADRAIALGGASSGCSGHARSCLYAYAVAATREDNPSFVNMWLT